jgi:hypothetical protein
MIEKISIFPPRLNGITKKSHDVSCTERAALICRDRDIVLGIGEDTRHFLVASEGAGRYSHETYLNDIAEE